MSSSPFVFEIGTDITKFTKSISEVENELKDLKNVLKTQTGAAIVETNKQIKALENSLVDLRKVGLDQLPKGVANGTNALFSLNQVARDLPFGFVAIQNNLPQVIDSFTQLSKESGGVKNAFKSLGSALAGPAGLSFAFGAAIAGITGLVQSYGSLGAAVTDIFGLQVKQKDLQNSLNLAYANSNGEIAGEVANLNSLNKILTSTNSTLEQRNGAYDQLNKSYPGILFGISKEEIASGKVNEQIAKRIKLYSLQLELEGKADSIRELISKSAKEQLELGAKLKTGGFFDVLGLQLKGFFQTGDAGVGGVLSAVTNTFQKTNAEAEFFKGNLDKVNQELVVVNGEVDKLVKGQKASEAASKSAAKENENWAKKSAESFYKYNGEALGAEKAFSSFVVGTTNLQKKSISDLVEAKKKNRKEDKSLATSIAPTTLVPPTGFGITKEAFDKGVAGIELNNLITKFENVKGQLENVFFNPLSDLFSNFFETGKFAFKDFTKSILQAISQIVSKIIATGIIQLIANILVPGGAAAAGIGLKGGGFLKTIGSALGFSNVAAPSFAGVGAGSIGMSGSVNMVLRGSDLVGSINRTNSTINRVG
jgi:hypothetical protein